MAGRLVIVALFAVALGSIGASVGASTREAVPAVTCSLPGTVPCLTDPQCTPYGAVCDVQSGACVCATGDLGSDLGASDLAGADFASDGGGGTGGGGGGSGVFIGGGGMTGPPKTGSSGCSYAPGSR